MRLQKVLLCLVLAFTFSSAPAMAAPGNLDNDFGLQGLMLTDVHDILTGTPGIGGIIAVAIHPPGDPNEGKIVGVGFTQLSGLDFSLARYNTDGSLDIGFGTNGVVETDLDDVDLWQAVLILPPGDPNAGKILAAGASGDDDSGVILNFALARYCADGSLDDGANCGGEGFGSGGIVTTVFPDDENRINALALQDDGKIVAAGFAGPEDDGDFAVARYLADGELDRDFNPSGSQPGTVVTDFDGGNDQAFGLVIYPEGDSNAGKILAAGFADLGEEDSAFVRYCPDGSLDTGDCGGDAFASGGLIAYDTGGDDQLQGLTLQPDGKAVGAGFANNGIDDDILLIRICGDGALDNGSNCGAEAFGEGGFVITEVISGSNEDAEAVVLQADGKILAGGSSDANGISNDFAVIRYLSDGSLDFGFGQAGIVLQDFSCLCSDSNGRAMALQADGKIVLAGASDANPANDFNNFALARFIGDAVIPVTPNADLAVTLSSDPAGAVIGESVTLTAVVTNNGPDSVSTVSLSSLLIGPFADLSVDSEACAIGSGVVSCDLGALDSGASASVTITILAQGFPFSLVADVNSDLVDPNDANNQAVLTLEGDSGGGDDGGCSLSLDSTGSPWGMAILAAGLLLLVLRRRNLFE